MSHAQMGCALVSMRLCPARKFRPAVVGAGVTGPQMRVYTEEILLIKTISLLEILNNRKANRGLLGHFTIIVY
jgi:hypothetical protein